MKKLALLALVLALPALAMPPLWRQQALAVRFEPLILDTFSSYSNGALPSPYAVMTGQTGAFTVTSHVITDTSLSNDNGYRYTTVQPSADQWCSVVIGTPGTVNEGEGYGCALRMSSSSENYDYGVCNGSGSALAHYLSGTGSGIGAVQTTTTCASGDLVVMGIKGTMLNLWRVRSGTWTLLNTGTESTLTSGFCGLTYSSTDNGGSIIGPFTCGNLH